MAWVNADAGKLDEAVALARRSLPYALLIARPPADSPFSRLKLAWGQLYLATFLRRQDSKRNAGEVQSLADAVRVALQRDPDAGLAAKLKTLMETKR